MCVDIQKGYKWVLVIIILLRVSAKHRNNRFKVIHNNLIICRLFDDAIARLIYIYMIVVNIRSARRARRLTTSVTSECTQRVGARTVTQPQLLLLHMCAHDIGAMFGCSCWCYFTDNTHRDYGSLVSVVVDAGAVPGMTITTPWRTSRRRQSAVQRDRPVLAVQCDEELCACRHT